VPEDVRLPVGKGAAEPVADAVEDARVYDHSRVDEGPVKVEQVEIVVGDGHGAVSRRPTGKCVVGSRGRL